MASRRIRLYNTGGLQHSTTCQNTTSEDGNQTASLPVNEYEYLLITYYDNTDCADQIGWELVDDVFEVVTSIPVPGCMDPDAANYDPTANEDDGSCTYGAMTSICTTDATTTRCYGTGESEIYVWMFGLALMAWVANFTIRFLS